MSKEFIEAKINSKSLSEAVRQEDHLSYFINSKLQGTGLDAQYISNWADRKYQTNDYFLNWVKMIFKSENFLSFAKYMRFPLTSARIIKNRIEPQLHRVFMAEDSDFKYEVANTPKSDYIGILNPKKFNEEIFERLLYKHNSIIISDLDAVVPNMPIRYYVDIKNVVSISESKTGDIDKIAYSGSITIDGETIYGYVYIDSEYYKFYNKEKELIAEKPHDLGYTPADFINKKRFNFDFVVRESLYTYIRQDIEEYAFLKILQKMLNTSGVFPVVTKIETQDDESEGQRGSEGQPDASHIIGSQQSKVYSQNKTIGSGDLQPGTIHEVPLDALVEEGKVNTAIVEKFLNFHYLPVEILEYISKKIKELELQIESTIVGDFLEGNETAKNELQIEKSLSALQNTLVSLSETLNVIRKKSDTNMLALRYGVERVTEVFIHYGTDFFLESQTKLYEDLAKAPNTLERKKIIKRINQNRHKNNIDQAFRTDLLYDLLPYISDKDFEVARVSNLVDPVNFEYQVRFNYWISKFESLYGDIVSFYRSLEADKAQRLELINNLIIQLITPELTINNIEQ